MIEAQEANESDEGKLVRSRVTDEEIAEVVSRWTGIPVAKMLEGEKDKLLHMEDALHARVVGQNTAVTAVVHLQAHTLDLQARNGSMYKMN